MSCRTSIQDDNNAPEQENRDPNEDESDEEEDSVEDFDEEGRLINESQMSHDFLYTQFLLISNSVKS